MSSKTCSIIYNLNMKTEYENRIQRTKQKHCATSQFFLRDCVEKLSPMALTNSGCLAALIFI